MTAVRLVNDPPSITLATESDRDSDSVMHRNNGMIEAFGQYQQMRGMSPDTIKRRRTSLVGFARWMAPIGLADATGRDVEEWLGTKTSPRTRHAYKSDLAAFYSWAVRRHLVDTNPMTDVDPIRVPKSMPRPVPTEAVPAIIAACPSDRLRLALELAAYAGLRRAEICRLTADDIRTSPRPAIVLRRGKGQRDRVIPLHPKLAKAVAGRRGRLVPLAPDTLGRQASEYLRSCGHDCTLHQLRASFATEMARVLKGDVRRLQPIMGHESVETTMGYVDLLGDDMGDEMGGLYGDVA